MKLIHTVNKPAAFVFDYLINPEKFVSVHPVIYKIDKQGVNTWKIYEKLKLFYFPVSFTYPVTVDSCKEKNRVIMTAVVMKMVSIRITASISQCGRSSIIKEEMVFSAASLLRPVMQRIFRKHHIALFKNMETVQNTLR